MYQIITVSSYLIPKSSYIKVIYFISIAIQLDDVQKFTGDNDIHPFFILNDDGSKRCPNNQANHSYVYYYVSLTIIKYVINYHISMLFLINKICNFVHLDVSNFQSIVVRYLLCKLLGYFFALPYQFISYASCLLAAKHTTMTCSLSPGGLSPGGGGIIFPFCPFSVSFKLDHLQITKRCW